MKVAICLSSLGMKQCEVGQYISVGDGRGERPFITNSKLFCPYVEKYQLIIQNELIAHAHP